MADIGVDVTAIVVEVVEAQGLSVDEPRVLVEHGGIINIDGGAAVINILAWYSGPIDLAAGTGFEWDQYFYFAAQTDPDENGLYLVDGGVLTKIAGPDDAIPPDANISVWYTTDSEGALSGPGTQVSAGTFYNGFTWSDLDGTITSSGGNPFGIGSGGLLVNYPAENYAPDAAGWGLSRTLSGHLIAIDAALAGGGTSSWDDLEDLPTDFPPSAHGHPISDVSGLQTALDDKVADTDPRLSDARTPLAHTHPATAVSTVPATTGLDPASTDVEKALTELAARPSGGGPQGFARTFLLMGG